MGTTPKSTMGEEEEEDVALDFSKKKKKKKPKADEGEGDADGGAAAADDDAELDLDFSKKKKKKKAKDEEEADDAALDDDMAALDLTKKKKKSKDDDDAENDDDDDDDDETDADDEGADGFISIPADREYKYEELLDRMYSLLHANDPELAGDRKRFLMKPPQVVREGSKRVVIINFGDICKTLNRSPEHVFSFMLAEMGTTGSIDASTRMV